jgi:hypothetical protein
MLNFGEKIEAFIQNAPAAVSFRVIRKRPRDRKRKSSKNSIQKSSMSPPLEYSKNEKTKNKQKLRKNHLERDAPKRGKVGSVSLLPFR